MLFNTFKLGLNDLASLLLQVSLVCGPYFFDASKIVKQQQDIFNILSNNVISAKQGTEEIEGGIVETIHNPVKIRKVAFELIKCALDEILISFSTVTVFSSQLGKGIMELLEEAALSQHGVKIRMLSPMDNQIKETTQKLKKQQQIHIRYSKQSSQTIDFLYHLVV